MRWKEIDAVFERSARKLYIIAMGVTGNRAMAEDAVHQALISVRSSDSVPRNPEAYLCRCVRHEALKAKAGRKKYVPDASEFLAEAVDSDSPRPEEDTIVQQVCDAMDALSSNQREAIVMHIFGGLTFREISEIREAPLGTVTSWYRRGMASLRTRVLDDE
jgi:RNA polymerase sigma-70 factor (ECF subfamily)